MFLGAGRVSIELTESQWLSPKPATKPATMFWSLDCPLLLPVAVGEIMESCKQLIRQHPEVAVEAAEQIGWTVIPDSAA